MDTFGEMIERWLSRGVLAGALNQCLDLPVVLATDLGLQRSENQDRVAALRITARASGGRPFVAVAVADGMGGMRDGAKCAALALSGFFHALIIHRSLEIEQRATKAMADANDAVFNFAGGKGGATLSALLLDHNLKSVIVHLGDTRIYAFDSEKGVERLTTDDSIAEAVGGYGRDLLQFVGIGEGIKPQLRLLPRSTKNIAITTDGIHFVEPNTFDSVLLHAESLRLAAERLAALARWCGGADNASSALIDFQMLIQAVGSGANDGIEFWDPFGMVTTIWPRVGGKEATGDRRLAGIGHGASTLVVRSESLQERASPGRQERKVTRKRAKGEKQGRQADHDMRVDIKVERSPESRGGDENSG